MDEREPFLRDQSDQLFLMILAMMLSKHGSESDKFDESENNDGRKEH